ncbi:hypothetical protein NEOKW01_1654 [Nematocida sp. AWRm80]|nr:hypothetical protein NEOKW01_1654 [Nematocida sp. AWRm80]
MWTTTTRLHLLNAVSQYGLKKASFINAYLKVYAKAPLSNWKKEYHKMIKEYLKNKDPSESVRSYFQKKRKETINSIIEKKKQEKGKIIERMIYGYDSIEDSEECSEDNPWSRPPVRPRHSLEMSALGETSISSFWGVKVPNTLSATLLHLSTFSNLPPHLELPGPKPEVLPRQEYYNSSTDECDSQQNDPYPISINAHGEELESILDSLENSGYGVSVSSVDPAAFEKFFKWTVDRLSLLDEKKALSESLEQTEQNAADPLDESSSQAAVGVYTLKEYYSLDFHEYPKKKSPRDKSKWTQEFLFLLFRLKSILGGILICNIHSETQTTAEILDEKTRKKSYCPRCFNAEALGNEMEKDQRPSLSEYVFRAMLFLQTVIFMKADQVPFSEVDMIKNELYKFYEYYRK